MSSAVTVFLRVRRACSRAPVYLVDEVADVPGVGHARSEGVLGLGVDGPLVQPSDSHRLDGVRLHRVGLLKLAQVVILRGQMGISPGPPGLHRQEGA